MEPELLADHFEKLEPRTLARAWVAAVVDQFSRWGLVRIGDGTTGQLARALVVVNQRLHGVEWKGLEASGMESVVDAYEREKEARIRAMAEQAQRTGSALGIAGRAPMLSPMAPAPLGDGIQLVVDSAPPEVLKTKHPKLADAIQRLLKTQGSQAHLRLDGSKYSRRVVGIVVSAMARHAGKPLGLKTWVSGSSVIVAKDSNVKDGGTPA